MERVISSEKLPIKMWLSDVEVGAMVQAENLANLPFAYRHIAIMPDCHQGYGMPIGGVLATRDVVIPNAVGVDIGCGMCAQRTPLLRTDITGLREVIDRIRQVVPVGFSWHAKPQSDAISTYLSTGQMRPATGLPVVTEEYEMMKRQIGTLGGGNHFVEVQQGSDDHVWIMIHSGSRNLGKKVADHYNKLAVELNEKWLSVVPKEWQLAFFPIDRWVKGEAEQYISEMEYCVEFAFLNRMTMMDRVKAIFGEMFGVAEWEPMINIAHNYARMEHHFGNNVMVHRKGATSARVGETGIIPGSQGTKSYIVRGKGNVQSFMSCSHGAGRRMGRRQAKRELKLVEQQKILDSQGIIHSVAGVEDLDEAPGAYKDIEEVMKQQGDLVEVLVELTPLAVIKG